jgi:hypothetical protein
MHFRHDPAGTTVIAKRRQEKPMMKHDPDVQDLTARYGTRVLDPVRAPGRHAIAAWALAVAVALAAFLGPPLTRQAVAALLELRHGVLMLDRELERVSVRLAGNALTKDAGSISLGRSTAGVVAAAIGWPSRQPSDSHLLKISQDMRVNCVMRTNAIDQGRQASMAAGKGDCRDVVILAIRRTL